jgi:two-component system sensor histidine kinase PilS (NtrC family)
LHFATLYRKLIVPTSLNLTFVRALLGITDDQLRAALDPRRVLRWIYVGRLSLATAIFIAALFNWFWQDVQSNTLIASLAFALSVMFTAWGAWYSMFRSKPLTDTFLYGQLIFDVMLVTSVVHVTGQKDLSLFAPLYVVVFTSAALLLPIGSSLLLALFGSVLYATDVLLFTDVSTSTNPSTLALQLSIFIVAALGISLISSRLQFVGLSSSAALTQARLEAADILGHIRSGIITIDPAGALLYANGEASRLLQIDFASRSGQPILHEIGMVAPGMRGALQRAIDERTHTLREEASVALQDRSFPIGVTTTSNDGDGERVNRSITAIFQDISDQKRVEQLRHRAERLEAVAELSASLAHEIRNPLASIRSAVEQIGHSPRTTPDEQVLARLIVRESDRLSRLLGEFLDFARTRVTRVTRVDLCSIAQGATKLAAAHPSRAEGVRVECVTPPLPVPIDGDEDLLHRAVFNLALNAVQAAPQNGHVRVEVLSTPDEPLPSGVRFEHGAVALRVTDDGSGIAAEMRDRIFQPFATTKPGGSGLGLPLVHRAIEAHRGLVFVDSDDRGARFTVLLPALQTRPYTIDGAAS